MLILYYNTYLFVPKPHMKTGHVTNRFTGFRNVIDKQRADGCHVRSHREPLNKDK